MDSRQLAVLVAVAENGSFSEAARQLHTVQSNVSGHIARLEKELEASLIDRSNGTLTAEGRAVYSRARRIQGELDAIGPDLSAMRDQVTGTVRLGLISTVGRWLLPPLYSAISKDYPLIHLHVSGAPTSKLVPSVAEGSVQLAVVNLPIEEADVAHEALFDEARVLAAPAGTKFADRYELTGEPIELEELAKLNVLVAPKGTAFRDEIDTELRDHGIALSPPAEIDSMELLASVVVSDRELALLPASSLRPTADIVGVPIRSLAPRRVGLAWNRRFPPPAPTRIVFDVIRSLVYDEAQRQPGLEATNTLPAPQS